MTLVQDLVHAGKHVEELGDLYCEAAVYECMLKELEDSPKCRVCTLTVGQLRLLASVLYESILRHFIYADPLEAEPSYLTACREGLKAVEAVVGEKAITEIKQLIDRHCAEECGLAEDDPNLVGTKCTLTMTE